VALKQTNEPKLANEAFEKAKKINPDHVMIETKSTDISGKVISETVEEPNQGA